MRRDDYNGRTKDNVVGGLTDDAPGKDAKAELSFDLRSRHLLPFMSKRIRVDI